MEKNNAEKVAEKHVNGLVDGAIKSSINHGKLLLLATVASVLFAAQHGQCGPLTRLHKEVTGSDAEGIRIFIVNMVDKYGISVTGQDGQDRKVTFLKFKKGEGFSLNVGQNENTDKAIKAMKATVIKAGEEELSKLPMAKMDRESAMADAFDTVKTVKRTIMTLARNGDAAMAREINRLLGNQGYTIGEIDATAKQNDPLAKLSKLKDQQEKLEKQIANNSNRPAVAAPAVAALN